MADHPRNGGVDIYTFKDFVIIWFFLKKGCASVKLNKYIYIWFPDVYKILGEGAVV